MQSLRAGKESDIYMYIMYKNTPVLHWDWNAKVSNILSSDYLPFSLRSDSFGYTYNTEDILFFLSERTAHLAMCRLLHGRNLKNFVNIDDPGATICIFADIAMLFNGISLTDSYWCKKDDSDITWENVNLRNSSGAILHSVKLPDINFESSVLYESGHQSMEFVDELKNRDIIKTSTPWRYEGDVLYLYKTRSQEPDSINKEICVSKLLDCFNVNHAVYKKCHIYNSANTMCKSRVIVLDTYDMIYPRDVRSYCERTGKDYVDFVMTIDKDNFAKLNVISYLIGNNDLSEENYAFLMDIKSGQLVGLCPFFDYGSAFCEYNTKPNTIKSCIYGREEKTLKEVAYEMIDHCELLNIKPIKRKMFLTDLQYETFMHRLQEMGIKMI